MRIGLIAAALLTAPLWGQDKPKAPSTAEAAEQVRTIQTRLQTTAAVGDFQADVARREKEFDGLKEIVSRYVVARIEASPDIKVWDLRNGLIDVLGVKYDERLGPDNFHQPPYVFRIEPPYLSNRPVVFALVYDGDVYDGSGGARVVVESYALEKGKARLAGRGGSELNGIYMRENRGGAQQVGADELLVQGLVAWSSGHELPYGAALYRVTENGVETVWAKVTPGLHASVFGSHLMVEYHDEKLDNGHDPDTRLDVYYLDNGVPKLVFQRVF